MNRKQRRAATAQGFIAALTGDTDTLNKEYRAAGFPEYRAPQGSPTTFAKGDMVAGIAPAPALVLTDEKGVTQRKVFGEPFAVYCEVERVIRGELIEGTWYSTHCPEGEYGTNPLDHAGIKLTKAEWTYCHEHDWPTDQFAMMAIAMGVSP
jgi:hypothetical protein